MLCASLVNSACHVHYCYCLVTVFCVVLVNGVCHVLLLLPGDHLYAGLINSVYLYYLLLLQYLTILGVY